SNLVLAYEMLILFAVLATLVGFIVGARLMRKRGPFYDKAVSLDQIGIVIEKVDDIQREQVRALFAKHRVIDVFEETGT
ncbi:MAG: DUF3341 domain-containing protein, partial [Rhodospirillaceae bacterium]|nr:DUF3341 domain-containing protein [Rhodospirillaceae bacterium]